MNQYPEDPPHLESHEQNHLLLNASEGILEGMSVQDIRRMCAAWRRTHDVPDSYYALPKNRLVNSILERFFVIPSDTDHDGAPVMSLVARDTPLTGADGRPKFDDAGFDIHDPTDLEEKEDLKALQKKNPRTKKGQDGEHEGERNTIVNAPPEADAQGRKRKLGFDEEPSNPLQHAWAPMHTKDNVKRRYVLHGKYTGPGHAYKKAASYAITPQQRKEATKALQDMKEFVYGDDPVGEHYRDRMRHSSTLVGNRYFPAHFARGWRHREGGAHDFRNARLPDTYVRRRRYLQPDYYNNPDGDYDIPGDEPQGNLDDYMGGDNYAGDSDNDPPPPPPPAAKKKRSRSRVPRSKQRDKRQKTALLGALLDSDNDDVFSGDGIRRKRPQKIRKSSLTLVGKIR